MNRLFSLLLLCLVPVLAPPAFAQASSDSQKIKTDLSNAQNFEELSRRLAHLATAGTERILSYDIDVKVNADNTLDVEETIRVHAEGNQIRRGIYRDFPTRYKDRYGNNVVVGFTVESLRRDGRAEPWFTENLSNGVRVNFGNDDFLQVPADYTYTLRYRTTRQVGFFDDHDELYWNAIGTGWNFSIEQGSVSVHLPQPVAIAAMRAEGYTGAQGEKGQDFTATLPAPGEARWTLKNPLPPQNGLTIVLSFPKGIVAAPSAGQKATWFLKDNRSILMALGALILMFGYLFLRWTQIGRDPPAGIIISRYEPPAGYSPAALRFIRKMAADDRCFTADLVALAVQGLIHIKSEKKLLGSDKWTLERTGTKATSNLPASQRALLEDLFDGGNILPVTPANRTQFMSAKLTQTKVMEKAYSGRMFKRNGKPTGLALLVGIAAMVVAFSLSGGAGIPILIAISFAMLVTLIVFGRLLAAPTPEGRKLLDEIEGLKLYLSVAEREDLARLRGPGAEPALDAGRYESLLPYAIALDVEDAWTAKFTAAVGAAAAQEAASNLSWYHGAGIGSLSQLSNSLGGSFSSSIASASTPPGSSSGGGGGGSSGGGGGGGGGGGR